MLLQVRAALRSEQRIYKMVGSTMNDTNDEVRTFINELFHNHYTGLREMVSKEISCDSIAEDIIQETFYEALCNSEELLTHENPGEWLKETAKRRISESKTNFMKHPERESAELSANLSRLEAASGFSELSFLTEQPLSLHEKALFYMYHYAGFTAEELAEIEEIPEKSFLAGMRRLCKKLWKRLKETKPEQKKKKD